MDLEASILRFLRSSDEPCTVVDIAHALGVLEPGDTVPDRLRNALTHLVRFQRVKRVHNGDGVLRYSALAPTSTTTVVPPLAADSKSRQAGRPHRYQTGVSDRVLAAMVPGEEPVRRTEIEARISPPLTTTQVVMALQTLRLKGIVACIGNTAGAKWHRLDKAAPKKSATAPIVDTRAGCRAALLQVREAVDAALKALETCP